MLWLGLFTPSEGCVGLNGTQELLAAVFIWLWRQCLQGFADKATAFSQRFQRELEFLGHPVCGGMTEQPISGKIRFYLGLLWGADMYEDVIRCLHAYDTYMAEGFYSI